MPDNGFSSIVNVFVFCLYTFDFITKCLSFVHGSLGFLILIGQTQHSVIKCSTKLYNWGLISNIVYVCCTTKIVFI